MKRRKETEKKKRIKRNNLSLSLYQCIENKELTFYVSLFEHLFILVRFIIHIYTMFQWRLFYFVLFSCVSDSMSLCGMQCGIVWLCVCVCSCSCCFVDEFPRAFKANIKRFHGFNLQVHKCNIPFYLPVTAFRLYDRAEWARCFSVYYIVLYCKYSIIHRERERNAHYWENIKANTLGSIGTSALKCLCFLRARDDDLGWCIWDKFCEIDIISQSCAMYDNIGIFGLKLLFYYFCSTLTLRSSFCSFQFICRYGNQALCFRLFFFYFFFLFDM